MRTSTSYVMKHAMHQGRQHEGAATGIARIRGTGRLAALLLACLLGGCSNSHRTESTGEPTTAAPPAAMAKGKNMSTWERVKGWAGAEASVGHYEAVAVPGYELFWIDVSQPNDNDRGYAVAVPAGKDEFLTGKDALRALLATGLSRPADMAQLALAFLEHGGELLTGADSEAAEQAGVSAPRQEADVLTYWYRKRGISSAELRRSTLHLDTLEVETTPVSPGVQDPVAEALKLLAGSNPNLHMIAVEMLVEGCDQPGAVEALDRTAKTHERAQTRELATKALRRCPGAATR